ncbi:MAG: two-component regulator propeller domain-containing protein [Bacteroidota bacterium]
MKSKWLIVVMGFFMVYCANAQQPALFFRHLSTVDGLSQSHGLVILQDSKGFLWFGTLSGLNKYDGYRFTVYKNDPADPTSLSTNTVTNLAEDKDGNIWVGTPNGLNMLDPTKNSFVRFTHNPNNSRSLRDNWINDILIDKQNNLWVATRKGLSLFNRQDKFFTHFLPKANDPHSISDADVRSICQDRKGNLWLGTKTHGLNWMNSQTRTFSHFIHQPGDSTSINPGAINLIIEDRQGILWIATWETGLNRFDPKTKQFSHYTHDINNRKSLSNNTIYSMFVDSQDNFWLGTENAGLNLMDKATGSFVHYKHEFKNSITTNSVSAICEDRQGNIWLGMHRGGIDYFNKRGQPFKLYKQEYNNSLSHNNVKSFLEDDQGRLWIGTDGGGLNVLDRKTDYFTHYRYQLTQPDGLSADVVLALYKDQQNQIWLGTWGGGLSLYNSQTNTFKHFKHEERLGSISSNNVWTMLEDQQHNFWVGTSGGGLNLFDREKQYFTAYHPEDNNPYSLSHLKVQALCEDRYGQLWVGTVNGLNRFDATNKRFIRYLADNKPGSLSNREVNVIFKDSRGLLWIGTSAGLNLYNPATDSFVVFREKEGLPSESIMGMVEDGHSMLWISTLNGLCRFDYLHKTFKKFNAPDGLQGNEFSQNAQYRNTRGEMFFGGVNGFNIFHPDSIRENRFIPPVYLTDFQVFNQSVKPGLAKSPLKSYITSAKEITLSYQQSVFSFEFAALNYTTPEKNQYAYQMEGFDKDWTYVGNKRSATYTNLDPGTYTFRVKASNNDGFWNEKGASIIVHILPPLWQTWWFRLAALLLIGMLALGWHRYRTKQIRDHNRELESKVMERTYEIEKQKHKIESQRDNLNHLNQQLGRKVEERTKELQVANQELNASFEDLTHIHQQLMESSTLVEKSLQEKEVLLAEVHHRVKNNLAVISGLMQLQLFSTDNIEMQALLRDSQSRIKSMALIHEKLYQNGTFANIEFAAYIQDLVKEIAFSYADKSIQVKVDLQVDPIYLELTAAIPCGLLLNELVTNAYKHAFVNREKGQLDIVFTQEGERIVLQVCDDGVGLDPDFDLQKSSSVGMQVIQTLVKQLKGKAEFLNKKGLSFSLTFVPVKMKTWASGHFHSPSDTTSSNKI